MWNNMSTWHMWEAISFLSLPSCLSRTETTRLFCLQQTSSSRGLLKLPRMEVKWIHVTLIFFFLLSVAMTGCFLWQYSLPKVEPGPSGMEGRSEAVQMCPRYPEPVPLDHPIPILKDALEKVDTLLRNKIHSPGLSTMSAIVIYNDTVLWTGNFGKKNGSNPFSAMPNEYTIYRIASISKVFPTIMLYRLWEEGKVTSLDDPLERYTRGFVIKNPLGRLREAEQRYTADGLVFLEKGSLPLKPSPVTLRRMASQLSGLPRRLRSTSLLWKGSTQEALALLKDDVLVADPGTRCHYSNLAFSLMAHVLADRAAAGEYQRWVSENILDRLGMEDTGFDITPPIRSQMAVGFYSSGQPAPLYDLGWYRPSGQMYSTAADLAKLAMVFLGTYHRRLLEPDTVKTMLTPLFKCSRDYFANKTGTPWEINEQLGYDVIRKDGDLDGYSATFSLIPKLRLSFIVLMAGPRPQGGDIVTQTYETLIPAMETAFREAEKSLNAPPSPAPYVGYYTYSNLTFYEIKAGSHGVLVMQQFGPHIEELIPENYRTIKLHHLEDRVFQVVFDKEFPCVLRLGSASVSLETQDGQLFNFYPFDRKCLSPGFDAPGLNTYNVVRIHRKPVFYS
ncbi:putative beta-lactamase-like 1 isoform X1 [Alligator mississippiensis]|uniref:putative beta-lactamase-like 1 isoform X1 n=1 Tax=Alligator mississippiensis TaxID=8496 RepID=UPI002877F8E9|nr:putative beta-lactamase-like 1 isoform X1 [Alligator mississippiensis]